MPKGFETSPMEKRVSFDLLRNSFVILHAKIDDSREDIASAFDDALSEGLSEEELLREARRELLAPRLRIQATVEYLPDATDNSRVDAIDALRQSKPFSDMIAVSRTLPPFSRTVFLSNIAQLQPSSGILKSFALSHAEVHVAELIDSIGKIGERAGMPRPQREAVAEAIDIATTQNADRLFSAYTDVRRAATDMKRCLEEGLPRATDAQVNAFGTVVGAYGRKISGSTHALQRRIEDAAETIRSDPTDTDTLTLIVELLREWDGLAQPQQILAQHKGRDDPASRDLFQFLRGVMLDLANDKSAAAAALEINKACLDVFAELPRAVQQLRADASSLQELVDQAGFAELHQFVEAAKRNLDPLVRDLTNGGFSRNAPGLAGRLYVLLDQSLVSTYGTSAAEYPWGIVRILALDINNDLGEGTASEKLIAGLRSHPKFTGAPAEMRASIEADLRILKSNALQSRFKRAIDRKDRKEARQALVELVSYANADERWQYQQAIDAIDSANKRRITKFIVWGVILLVVIGYSISQNGGDRRSSSNTYRQPSTSAPTTRNSEGALQEIKPPIGTNISFTRGNIRYCLYLSTRLDAIKSELYSETNNRVISLFNREVDDYNSRCSRYRYYPNDLSAVQREVTYMKAKLEAEGRQLLNRWRVAN